MSDFRVRRAEPADEEEVLRLNEDSVFETSSMDSARFRCLFEIASRFMVAERDGRIVGFFIGLCGGVAYDSVNYQWFESRLKRFCYIDRVVVAKESRGAGIGRAFYSQLESWASDVGLSWLAAEMNLEPPNRVSLAFHANRGFRQLATQVLPSGKVVSMQVRSLEDSSRPAGLHDGFA
jgi:predicted GNAT superfamily acetyltransferase